MISRLVQKWLAWSTVRTGWRETAEFLTHYLGGLRRGAREHHLLLMAGGLAFSILVCILPLVLVIFSVLGMALRQEMIANAISAYIDRAIPYHSEALRIKVLTFNRLSEFGSHKNFSGIAGTAGLLLAATGLFSSMRAILNRVFRIDRESFLFREKLHDLIMILLVLLFFLLSIAVIPLLDVIDIWAGKLQVLQALDFELIEAVVLECLTFVVIFAAYGVIYFAVPGRRPPFRTAFVSAAAAALLWEFARQLFGLYLTEAITLTRIYGAYAFVVTVAFWIYYSSVVFIVGAQIGQLHRVWKVRRKINS